MLASPLPKSKHSPRERRSLSNDTSNQRLGLKSTAQGNPSRPGSPRAPKSTASESEPRAALLFQQIPVLKVDNTVLNQSTAIARYLAREAGLVGRNSLEQAQADAIVDTINDFMNLFPWTEKNPAVKEKIMEDVFANKIPLLLDGLSKLLGNQMWFVGDSVTWADFHWAVCSITLTNLNVDILHNYPKLLALKERVEALPKIAAWIEQRPKTPL
ncbi:hematopoietic prostaglandin D synthase-like isoform X1 [Carcharodon carcharias]|uniref:hematopoietic prostaglandin D synthase-like isoform X1 n=1 Tax=Carcharodon carcharias TaxID=13397 RepID=UPI001B7F2281|nr:hematopoietic prostaglandin D synthase-like isoform X1 [Carcharodon carcharias]